MLPHTMFPMEGVHLSTSQGKPSKIMSIKNKLENNQLEPTVFCLNLSLKNNLWVDDCFPQKLSRFTSGKSTQCLHSSSLCIELGHASGKTILLHLKCSEQRGCQVMAYSKVLIDKHGSVSGLSEFAEIIQICYKWNWSQLLIWSGIVSLLHPCSMWSSVKSVPHIHWQAFWWMETLKRHIMQ